MGHAINYYTTDDRKEIMTIAEEFAYWNVDEQENPSRSYHGNMHIHDDIVCESYDDAMKKIDDLDRGWYDDHAVRYKDKDSLKPNKTMVDLKKRIEKNRRDSMEYSKEHSIKNRKSAYVGCTKCGSKISVEYLHGEECPVCGKDLRADYIIDRLNKYDKDWNDLRAKYRDAVKSRKEKCAVKWLIKVEVHC